MFVTFAKFLQLPLHVSNINSKVLLIISYLMLGTENSKVTNCSDNVEDLQGM